MTQHPALFTALCAPFSPDEVKVRSHAGKQIHYITARTAMNRLDEVLGPESWWDSYEAHENSVVCRLTIRLPDGTTLTKCDAGGYAGMADSGDDDKSGYSDSFKRAAVKFGVGRYLYRDGVPNFVAGMAAPQATRPDSRPEPDAEAAAERAPIPAEANGPARGPVPTRVNGTAPSGPPRTGKALYAWVKDRETEYEVGLLKYLNQWARLQSFPARMVDWDGDQVVLGHQEALRTLHALAGANGAA